MKNRISIIIAFVCLSFGLVFNTYASEQVEIKLFAGAFVPKDWSSINKPDFSSDTVIENAVFLGSELDSLILLDDDNVTWANFIAELKTKPIKQSSKYLQQSANVAKDYPDVLQYIVTIKNPSKKSQPFVGEIRLVVLEDDAKLSKSWLLANGQKVEVAKYPALYSLIGNVYGGYTTQFELPDLTAVEATLRELTGKNYRYIIAVNGQYPVRY